MPCSTWSARGPAGAQPAATIHLLEVLRTVARVERDPLRRAVLRRHVALACAASHSEYHDASVRAAAEQRHAAAMGVLDGSADDGEPHDGRRSFAAASPNAAARPAQPPRGRA
jgi:hypothetical protein